MTDPVILSKRPAEVFDVDFEFAAVIPTGDSISSDSATADAGLTLGARSRSGTVVKQFISGGAAGAEYELVCRILTSAGRTRELAARIRVQDAP